MSTNRAARRGSTRLLAPLAALLLLATLATPALAHDDGAHEPNEPGQAIGRLAPALGAELAEVRAATARYHDVEVAKADGFVASSPCVVNDGGDAAMGYHYVNGARIGQLDPTLPQALLYAPGPNGQLRLVGVEYLSPTGGELFGQPFADWSPVPPNENTALHVWLWQTNPLGMFAPYNPNVSCG